MAKCCHCKGCMRIIRVEFDSGSLLFYYCPLCRVAFYQHSRVEVEDKELSDRVENGYISLYGRRVF